MNILFIEQHPRFIGGSERISLSLCADFFQRGHSTYLLHEHDGDMLPAYTAVTTARHRGQVRPLAVRQPLATARSLRQLRQVLRQRAIDVIFTSQLGYVSLLGVVRQLWRTPSVVHVGLTLDFQSPLYRWAVPRIAAAVTPSEPMRAACLAAGWPAAHLRVIPNGVDTSRFKPTADRPSLRAQLGLPAAGPLVVYIGRLVEEKGVFTLVRAAAQLHRQGQPFHLAMIGSAPEGQREALAALAKEAGLGPEIFSLREPTHRPEDYYAAADVVVVPSEWAEPFGLAVIEAMASGAALVVSDAGILPQIVGPGQAGGVFPRGDVGALAERLRFILSNDTVRADWAASGLARVRASYDLRRCGDAYEQVLLECLPAR